MSLGLLIGKDEEVHQWVNHAFGLFPMAMDRVIGIVDKEGNLRGAILFRNFNGVNVELSYYGPNTLSAGIARSIARIILLDFKASRATVVTSKKKKALLSALIKIGFRIEGTQRCYYGETDCRKNTAVRLVMFREDIQKIAGLTPLSSRKLN